MARLTVCLVTASHGRGGLEKHFIELCNGLAGRHRMIAVCHPYYQDRLASGVCLEPLDLSGKRRNPLLWLGLYKAIKQHRPDIIHAHANKAAGLVGLVGRFLPAKRVATVHGLKRDTGVFRGFDRVIAVSRQVADSLDPGLAVEVIYNGIEPPRPAGNPGRDYLSKVLPARTGRLVVAAVGRLAPVKGIDILLQAWVGIDANLLIIGDGPLRSSLERQIRDLRLEENVRLLGFRDDVPTLLASVDLTVAASRREGFSYAVVESLHAHTPVIATWPVGKELLPEDVLVPAEDPDALHLKVVEALGRLPEIRNRFQPLFEFAARELTLARMIEKTDELYRRVLTAD